MISFDGDEYVVTHVGRMGTGIEVHAQKAQPPLEMRVTGDWITIDRPDGGRTSYRIVGKADGVTYLRHQGG